jgi:hypothetical protein
VRDRDRDTDRETQTEHRDTGEKESQEWKGRFLAPFAPEVVVEVVGGVAPLSTLVCYMVLRAVPVAEV